MRGFNDMRKLITFILTFVSLLCLSGCHNEAASIGVIGGADGPTAIFVTGNTNWLSVGGFLAAVIVAILVVVMIRKKK